MPTVLILGASSGLGYGLAEVYLKRGWNLGLAARRTLPLQAMARLATAQQQVEVEQIDVCQPEQAAAQLENLCQRMGGNIDLYLHCSGIGKMAPCVDYANEEPTLQTNVMGWTACIDWAFNHMLTQGYGQIAAITSFAANRGLAPAPAYASSKAFQAHYLESLRQLALARGLKHICITDLRPGFVATPLLAHPERLFWVLTPEKAVKSMLYAIDSKADIRTITTRWRLLAPVLRWAPRWLIAKILARAL